MPTRKPTSPRLPTADLKAVRRMLPEALARDRLAVLDRLVRLEGSANRNPAAVKGEIRRLHQRLVRSARIRARRIRDVPSPALLPDLPITDRKDDIVQAIRSHRVVVVSGETGSGKTTQIPKFCLEAGRGRDGWIGCTQPRRIAATSVADRLAEEFGEPLGRSVGYKIRFQDQTPAAAYVKVMTDGILLAETQGDPLLSRYDTLIVDEAHERSLNIDFVLGILKRLVDARSDLKLIITSATIDTEKFSQAFGGAPVIEVSGRLYPVELRYRPIDDGNGEETTHVEAAVQAVTDLVAESPWGDILVFMPTEQDIRETCDLLEGRGFGKTVILPLFARLSAGEQRRVFAGTAARKIIVATNVAETSITIPGIRYVVDTGLARVAQYSPRTRTTGLPVVPVSRSSADQRAGRCGRVQDGVCTRLFSEADYEGRPRFTAPEILRSNLAEVLLRMIALDLGEVSAFPFVDAPDVRSVKDGIALLAELGAVVRVAAEGDRNAGDYHLTRKGRLMARMPVDPRLSRMLIEAHREGCIEEVTIIAAALSIQDPRERPTESTQAADQAHSRFVDPDSDFVTLLNIWQAYHACLKKEKTSGALKRFCRASFLSFRRMREWRDIHRQLAQILKEAELGRPGPRPSVAAASGADRFGALYEAVHRSVLSGFLSNIAHRKEKNFFRASKGREVMVFPGSGLFNRAGDWIVAAETVETSRLFARTAANIDSRWIEPLAGDLCRRVYLDPRWERRRGTVIASEQVTLFGLVIEPGRPVNFGRIHPEEATEIFIRSALVEADVRKPLPFMIHNRREIASVTAMEDRLRRRGIFVGEEALFEFYRSRLENVWDIRSLNHMIKTRGDGFLRMRAQDLVLERPDQDELALYPERVALGASSFPVVYRFEPGDTADGISVSVPAAAASGVEAAAADWLVPGLLREKLTFLIKGLPKTYRSRLVPVKDTVDTLMAEMPREQRTMVSTLGLFIRERFGVDIPAAAWPLELLPEHLKMRFVVTVDSGKAVRTGRTPDVLCTNEPAPAPATLVEAKKQWEREGIVDWTFGDLPETVVLDAAGGARWALFPGLEAANQAEKINLRLFENREQALSAHLVGVEALYRLRFAKAIRATRRGFALPRHLADHVAYPGGVKAMETRIFDRVLKALFQKNIRTADAFERHGREAIAELAGVLRRWHDATVPVLEAVDEVRRLLFELGTANAGNPHAVQLTRTLTDALLRILPEHFVDIYDLDRLPHLIRYARAIGIRARRAVDHPEKDRAKAADVAPLTEALSRLVDGLDSQSSPEKREQIEQLFWWIEAYKVSVFAQELGTPERISRKRIRRLIDAIDRMA